MTIQKVHIFVQIIDDIKFCFAFPAFISEVAIESSSGNIGVIAGSIAGVVFLVAVVVAVILIYKQMSANRLSN